MRALRPLPASGHPPSSLSLALEELSTPDLDKRIRGKGFPSAAPSPTRRPVRRPHRNAPHRRKLARRNAETQAQHCIWHWGRTAAGQFKHSNIHGTGPARPGPGVGYSYNSNTYIEGLRKDDGDGGSHVCFARVMCCWEKKIEVRELQQPRNPARYRSYDSRRLRTGGWYRGNI
jgi:hypothetical protein